MPRIIPIKELKDSVRISDMCHTAGEPIFITKNGYGDMVIMSIETFERREQLKSVYRDLFLSEEDVRTGNIADAKEALEELKKKYEL